MDFATGTWTEGIGGVLDSNGQGKKEEHRAGDVARVDRTGRLEQAPFTAPQAFLGGQDYPLLLPGFPATLYRDVPHTLKTSS